jgi:predicted GIY-YIG superfamily endonuclease
MSERTAVYELFDAAGARLYIGMTNDMRRRLIQHRAKPWWILVDGSRTIAAWYPTREEATRVESRPIALHRPPHNTSVVGARQPIAGPIPWDTAVDAVDWDAVIDSILAEASPVERARAVGRAMASVRGQQVELKWQRQACVAEMRDRGMSLADIGRELGLHRNRVQQIAEGRSSGGQGGKTDEA